MMHRHSAVVTRREQPQSAMCTLQMQRACAVLTVISTACYKRLLQYTVMFSISEVLDLYCTLLTISLFVYMCV
jgi:hypothetical protein